MNDRKRRNMRVKGLIAAGLMVGVNAMSASAAPVSPTWTLPTFSSPTNRPAVNATTRQKHAEKPSETPPELTPELTPELKLIVSAPLRLPGGQSLQEDSPVNATPIPEPATSTLAAMAGMAMCYRPRRRGRAKP